MTRDGRGQTLPQVRSSQAPARRLRRLLHHGAVLRKKIGGPTPKGPRERRGQIVKSRTNCRKRTGAIQESNLPREGALRISPVWSPRDFLSGHEQVGSLRPRDLFGGPEQCQLEPVDGLA